MFAFVVFDQICFCLNKHFIINEPFILFEIKGSEPFTFISCIFVILDFALDGGSLSKECSHMRKKVCKE